MFFKGFISGIEVFYLHNNELEMAIVPSLGGRIISLFNKNLNHEFLWKNRRMPLKHVSSGALYDPNFYGGIDEILPNDIPECYKGYDYYDHGEIWTSHFENNRQLKGLSIYGQLRCGLQYTKLIIMAEREPSVEFQYTLKNTASKRVFFLWKMHGALKIDEGDEIRIPSGSVSIADMLWSRSSCISIADFATIDGEKVYKIPPKDGTTDFLHWNSLSKGVVRLIRKRKNAEFRYYFDRNIFKVFTIFASFGGFEGYYTAVLEPSTAPYCSIKKAIEDGQALCLEPEQILKTGLILYAGPMLP